MSQNPDQKSETLFSSDADRRLERPIEFTGFAQRSDENPGGYVIKDEGLVAAINASLILGQPLLLTGDPGTGKTQLASRIAWQLRLPPPLKFETKSTSVSSDLFYTYDAVGRFNAAHDPSVSGDSSRFMTFNALGKAILLTWPHDRAKEYVADTESFYRISDDKRYEKPCRSVVLIDEIDKAPRDFPNDLLNELGERMFFRIPEMDNQEIRPDKDLRPIVIITSNSERNLPEPFLRRCVFYHIPFPDEESLAQILVSRVGGLKGNYGSRLVESAIDFFMKVRKSPHRKPSTAELINWLNVLTNRGASPDQTLTEIPELVHKYLSVLAKDKRERAFIQDLAKKQFPVAEDQPA